MTDGDNNQEGSPLDDLSERLRRNQRGSSGAQWQPDSEEESAPKSFAERLYHGVRPSDVRFENIHLLAEHIQQATDMFKAANVAREAAEATSKRMEQQQGWVTKQTTDAAKRLVIERDAFAATVTTKAAEAKAEIEGVIAGLPAELSKALAHQVNAITGSAYRVEQLVLQVEEARKILAQEERAVAERIAAERQALEAQRAALERDRAALSKEVAAFKARLQAEANKGWLARLVG